jgi:hypothetical protein
VLLDLFGFGRRGEGVLRDSEAADREAEAVVELRTSRAKSFRSSGNPSGMVYVFVSREDIALPSRGSYGKCRTDSKPG